MRVTIAILETRKCETATCNFGSAAAAKEKESKVEKFLQYLPHIDMHTNQSACQSFPTALITSITSAQADNHPYFVGSTCCWTLLNCAFSIGISILKLLSNRRRKAMQLSESQIDNHLPLACKC